MTKPSTPKDKNLVEPWPEPVDGTQLLRDLVNVIREHVILGEPQAVAVAAWTIQTWCYDSFDHAALLLVDAPEHACGKSLVLDLVAKLVRNPRESSGLTEAALFRVIELQRPTFLLDEADVWVQSHDGLVSVLNSGHARDGTVTRLEKVGDTYVPQDFKTFGCKVLAGIDLQRKMPASTLSRCIRIGMRRKLQGEEVKRLRKTAPAVFTDLRSRMLRFVSDHAEQLAEGFEDMPEELSDRDQNNWEALFAIANAAGPEALQMVCAAAVSIKSATETPQSLSNRLLANVRTVLADYDKPTIPTEDLLGRLIDVGDEMGWNSYNRGHPLKPRQLATLLRPYELSPRTVRQATGKTPKGYVMAELDEAFRRYLPPIEPATESASVDGAAADDEPATDDY